MLIFAPSVYLFYVTLSGKTALQDKAECCNPSASQDILMIQSQCVKLRFSIPTKRTFCITYPRCGCPLIRSSRSSLLLRRFIVSSTMDCCRQTALYAWILRILFCILGSSEALLSGQKPPFRLMVRAVNSRDGAAASNIRFVVSDAFVVSSLSNQLHHYSCKSEHRHCLCLAQIRPAHRA